MRGNPSVYSLGRPTDVHIESTAACQASASVKSRNSGLAMGNPCAMVCASDDRSSTSRASISPGSEGVLPCSAAMWMDSEVGGRMGTAVGGDGQVTDCGRDSET